MAEWFKDWFNTSYYHILYKHRDDSEAAGFIDRLLAFLNPKPTAHFLDVACGKGRHSIYLNNKGYAVTGIDISPNSIEKANEHKNSLLHFEVADMRQPFAHQKYDIAINLFTSFGYFDDSNDNLRALENIFYALKNEGRLVLDFFNTQKILANMQTCFTQTEEGILFSITKKVENGRIIKTIEFEADGQKHSYMEKVEAISKTTFEQLFAKAGFTVQHVFGGYQLEQFDIETSNRLIFVVKKTAK